MRVKTAREAEPSEEAHNRRFRGEHVDHIKPLALGGPNRCRNLQLLYVACNLREGAIDPIDFAQTRGPSL